IRSFPTIDDFLLPVSRLLQGRPNVRLMQLAWLASDDPKAVPPMQFTPAGREAPVRTLARTEPGAAPAAQQNAMEDANPPFAGGRYEIGLLEGTVRVGRNDFRGAVQAVERLAHDIEAIHGFSASIVESPLDANPKLGLQARYDEKPVDTMELRFVLRVVRDRGSAG
ncbi:MAG TPA: hypothetical protein VFP36_05465, partial [Usitatibacter sp.]|nr:hypothetical protein [Usitatibacter sp.]